MPEPVPSPLAAQFAAALDRDPLERWDEAYKILCEQALAFARSAPWTAGVAGPIPLDASLCVPLSAAACTLHDILGELQPGRGPLRRATAAEHLLGSLAIHYAKASRCGKCDGYCLALQPRTQQEFSDLSLAAAAYAAQAPQSKEAGHG